MMLMMREANHVQFMNNVTESDAKNETMMWLSWTGNSVSCSSPSTLSVLSMMEKNANSVNVNTASEKYMLVANMKNLLMKNEMTKYSVTESYAMNTMLLTMCEVDQVQVVNIVNTMLLMMHEVDHIQVVNSVKIEMTKYSVTDSCAMNTMMLIMCKVQMGG